MFACDLVISIEKIKSGEFTFSGNQWKNVSADAKDFITKMLVVDPRGRMTIHQALRHRWINESDDKLSEHELNESIEALKSFQIRQKFRRGVNAVIASNRFQRLMRGIRNEAELEELENIPPESESALDGEIDNDSSKETRVIEEHKDT
jgi:serine/threonine protein kinase